MSWTWPASCCFLCCFPLFPVGAEYLHFLAQGMVSTVLFPGRYHTCPGHTLATDVVWC